MGGYLSLCGRGWVGIRANSCMSGKGWGGCGRLFQFEWERVGAYLKMGAYSRLGAYSNKYNNRDLSNPVTAGKMTHKL